MGRNIHIVRHGNHWNVTPAKGRPVSSHRTQENAINAGRPIAKRNQSELVIHDIHNRIRDKDSYGGDPNPPKDRKH